MTGSKNYVIMDNTMDGWLAILILLFGGIAAAVIAFFFGKVGKRNDKD